MSRAQTVKLVIQVLACGGALAVFLLIPGIVWALLGFFMTWLFGSALAHWAFRRLATPEEIQADLRERADSTD